MQLVLSPISAQNIKLEIFINTAITVLNSGSKLSVMTFHSLSFEDTFAGLNKAEDRVYLSKPENPSAL